MRKFSVVVEPLSGRLLIGPGRFTNPPGRKVLLLFLALAAQAPAQQPGDADLRTRQLWDTTLLDKRPAPAKPAARKRPTSAPVTGALVGITIWRLRPSKPGDSREVRAMIHEESGVEEWTPERVASDMPLAEGQKVRFSTEAVQAGYLYVIDRDEYADGTKSAPYLIFPTTRTRGGDNHVTPGMMVEIPAPDDNPPFFKIQRSRPDQMNEVLTILISPKPIAELKIGRDRLQLSEAQVARWEKQWKFKSTKLEDAVHAGKVYTVAEKNAARGGDLLTQDDPLPQTMSHVDCKAGDTVMLDVPLKITGN